MRFWSGVVVVVLGLSSVVEGPAEAQTTVPQSKERGAEQRRAKAAGKQDAAKPFVLVGAGDVAACASLAGAAATAKLIEKIPGTVFVAGDLAYERGTEQEFRD